MLACISIITVGCSSDTEQGSDGPPSADTGVMDANSTVDIREMDSPDGEEPNGRRDTSDDTADSVIDSEPDGSDVNPVGFTVLPPRPASCDQPGVNQRIPFYFAHADDQSPIVKWDRINGDRLTPNTRLGAGSISSRRTRIAQQSYQTCESSADCPSPLKCGASGLPGAKRRCTFPTSVEFVPGTAQMDYRPNLKDDSKQLITFLVDNTTSYVGQLPNEVSTRYGEDGNIDTDEDPRRSTDPRRKHREALKQFSDRLPGAVNEDNTKISLWYYGGTKRANTRAVARSSADRDHFRDSVTLLRDWVSNELPNLAPRPANTYQAMLRAINQDLSLDKYADHEKFLFVVTDSPNEVYDSSATRTRVMNKLQEHNIRLVVLHIDAQIQPDALRDLPSYWKDSPPCESDADCANFETCRRAQKYPEDKSKSVTESTLKHCMPAYGDNGRLGPLEPYADMACRTRGHYLYVNDPQKLIWYAKRLPFMLDGQWSVEAEVSAFDEQLGLEGGYYRLSGVFFGLLGANLASTLSDVGPEGQNFDTRPLLRLQRNDDQ